MQRVINFSGGKTSGYMTISEYKEGDLVIFCDTGREHPKTHKFINDFEAFEKIPVIRLKYMDSENPFDELLKRKKYKVIPNRMKRICTVELKIRLCKRYLRSIGIQRFENLVGFRFDEEQRVLKRKSEFKKVKDRFPLYEKGITKEFINDYWSTKPYNLEIPSILGNCTLCFMKGIDAIKAILTLYPELAEPWINDEKNAAKSVAKVNADGGGKTYFKGITIEQIRNIAQNNLFKDVPEYVEYQLSQMKPSSTCACTP